MFKESHLPNRNQLRSRCITHTPDFVKAQEKTISFKFILLGPFQVEHQHDFPFRGHGKETGILIAPEALK